MYLAKQQMGATEASPGEKLDDTLHSSIARKASSAASAYHGYKRNKSVGWALVWAALGYMAPVITPVIAAAQGYGKPKGG